MPEIEQIFFVSQISLAQQSSSISVKETVYLTQETYLGKRRSHY